MGEYVKSLVDVSPDSLVFDQSIYPRRDVDRVHIRYIADAMAAGSAFPPVVAEVGTLRVTDGWHRSRAFKRAGVPIPEVRCWRYEDDTDALRHAIEQNSSHGLPLSELDRRRLSLVLRERGVALDEIAVVLHVPPPKIIELTAQVAIGPAGPVPLKRSVIHLRGTVMSAGQATAVSSAPGTSYALLVRQLVDALENGLLPENESDLDMWLDRLGSLIKRRSASVAAVL